MPLLKANDFWKPNTYYYATDRYKSLIEKDNTLYICSESHFSQDEFDATKFVGISGSGGSGGLTETQVNSLIEDALQDFTPSGSGGFSFGGDWDATPTETTKIAAFDVLDNSTVSNNQLTVISGTAFSATATNLSNSANVGTGHKFRVTVPSATPGMFLVMIHTSNLSPYEALNDDTATLRGINVNAGSVNVLVRDASTFFTYPTNSVNVGDILRLEYRADNSSVYIYNETQSEVLLASFVYVGGFGSIVHLSIYCGGVGTTLSFDFADDYPIYQSVFNFDYPDDLTKTYRISSATSNSTIDNKQLKVNDFVNFITQDDDIVDVVVSRLMTDAQIKTLTDTAIYDYLDNEQSDVDSNLSLYIKNLIQTELQDTNSSIYQAATYLTQAVITTETQSTGIIDNLMLSTLNAAGLTDGMDNIVSVQAVIGQECQSGGIIDTVIQSAINP